jgi:hypothetical protein
MATIKIYEGYVLCVTIINSADHASFGFLGKKATVCLYVS